MKGFFFRIWSNCVDPKSYSEVIKQPFAKSLGYISLLLFIYVLLVSIVMHFGAISFARHTMRWIDENIPEITIENGEISADVRQPYIRELDGFAVIIDTTGKMKKIDPKYEHGILVTKKQVFFKREDYRTEVYDVPENREKFILNAAMINSWINVGKYCVFPAILGFVYLFLWIAIIIKIFFYSLASLLWNAVFSAKLKYGSLLSIGAHALTLPFLLSILIEYLGIPLHWLIYNHLLYLIILGIIIRQNRQTAPEA